MEANEVTGKPEISGIDAVLNTLQRTTDELGEMTGMHNQDVKVIEALTQQVRSFQDMRPEEFKALWQAKCLKSGVHHGFMDAPGRVDVPVFNQLRLHGWIEPNPDMAGFWILTEAGRLLIGEDKD